MLDELGKALRGQALASYSFRIEGHTDTVGTRESNLALSERRAQRVVDYLKAKYGIDQARLQPLGMGQDHLLIPTAEGVAEPLNRRVQIVNLTAPAAKR